MRKPTRINPTFLENQKTKRDETESGSNNENSVPALRDRVNRLEELLTVKSYPSI